MALNANILSPFVILFMPSVLVVTAERDVCMQTLNVKCTIPYQRTTDSTREPIPNEVACPALAKYQRCAEDVRKSLTSCNSNLYFHTIYTSIQRIMKDKICGNVTLPINQTAVTDVPDLSTTSQPVQPTCIHFKRKLMKLINGKDQQNSHKFRLCALFGDPHLKTFNNERQTCVVQGAWPLIDNDFFSVQVTNVPLVRRSSATATNMVRSFKLFYFKFRYMFSRNVCKHFAFWIMHTRPGVPGLISVQTRTPTVRLKHDMSAFDKECELCVAVTRFRAVYSFTHLSKCTLM